jgi:hypothetical protein
MVREIKDGRKTGGIKINGFFEKGGLLLLFPVID